MKPIIEGLEMSRVFFVAVRTGPSFVGLSFKGDMYSENCHSEWYGWFYRRWENKPTAIEVMYSDGFILLITQIDCSNAQLLLIT